MLADRSMTLQRLERDGTMIGDTLAHTSHRAEYHRGNDRNARTVVVNDGSEMIKSGFDPSNDTLREMTGEIDRARDSPSPKLSKGRGTIQRGS